MKTIIVIIILFIIFMTAVSTRELQIEQLNKKNLTTKEYCLEYHSNTETRYLPAKCLSIFK